MISERKGRRSACETRVGGPPANRNLITFYAGGGFNLIAPFPGRNDDILADTSLRRAPGRSVVCCRRCDPRKDVYY